MLQTREVVTTLGLLIGVANSYCNWGLWNYFPIEEGQCGLCYGDCEGPFFSIQVKCSDDGSNATLYKYDDYYCSNVYNTTQLDYFDCDAPGDCNYYNDGINVYIVGLNETDCSGDADSVAALPLALLEDKICVYDEDDDFYVSINVSISQGLTLDIYSNESCTGTWWGQGGVSNYYCENDNSTGDSQIWVFSERNNDSDTTMAPSNSTNIDGICNFAFWNYWPIAQGYCGSCEGDGCGGVSSIYMDCDTDYAVLIYFDDEDCSGDAVNYTFLEYFYCDSDTCPSDYVVNMGLTGYEESGCGGDEEFSAELPLAYYATGCIEQSDDGGTFYLGITFYEDTIYLGVYGDSSCDGSVYYWLEIDDGYCDNSTEYSFEAYGGTRLTGDCNYGVWNNWPVAAGYCGSCEGDDCGGVASIYLYCESSFAVLYIFDDELCGLNGGSVGNYTFLDTYFCDKDTCDSDEIVIMSLTEYDEEECDGDTELEARIPLASGTLVCSNEGGYYLGVTVKDNGFFFSIYLDEYCNGTTYYSANFTDGVCDNSTMYGFDGYEDEIISSTFDCNFGLLSWWPLAEGFCSTCDGGDCDGTGSVNVVCANDGESATFYEYYNNDCTSVKNESETDIFSCDTGNTGDDCEDIFLLGITEYSGSDDCTGQTEFNATLYLTGGELCYQYAQQPFSYYVSLEASEDGLYVGIYLDDECSGKLYANFSYEDGECQDEGGNSTMFTLSEYTGGSGGSGGSDTDSAQSFKFVGALFVSLLFALRTANN